MVSWYGYEKLTNGIKAVHSREKHYDNPEYMFTWVGYDDLNKEYIYDSDEDIALAYANAEGDTVLPFGIDWHNTTSNGG